MKKFFISTVFVFGFVAYAAYNYFTGTSNAQASATPAAPTGPTITDTAPSTNSTAGSAPSPDTSTQTAVAQSPAPVSTPAPTPTPVSQPKKVVTGQYTDGTYTGAAADAYYGNIQVEATISGGRLTNVAFLQYPSDRSTSRMINQQAMPELKAEAIRAQSANVNGVSGASDSSAAFNVSLADALAQAKA